MQYSAVKQFTIRLCSVQLSAYDQQCPKSKDQKQYLKEG